MAWRRLDDKQLSEAMVVNLLMYICVTRPQYNKTNRWNGYQLTFPKLLKSDTFKHTPGKFIHKQWLYAWVYDSISLVLVGAGGTKWDMVAIVVRPLPSMIASMPNVWPFLLTESQILSTTMLRITSLLCFFKVSIQFLLMWLHECFHIWSSYGQYIPDDRNLNCFIATGAYWSKIVSKIMMVMVMMVAGLMMWWL